MTKVFRSKALSHAEGDVMPRVNGQPFRCECRCNVFRWVQAPTYAAIDVLACNACGALYEAEPAVDKGNEAQ